VWRKITQNDGIGKVNASYSGSILKKITFFTNPYNIFLNDSNGHDVTLKNIIILVFE
jgi:hypothetical protein